MTREITVTLPEPLPGVPGYASRTRDRVVYRHGVKRLGGIVVVAAGTYQRREDVEALAAELLAAAQDMETPR